MKNALDFEAINQAALAAFPAVLTGFCRAARPWGGRLSPSTRGGRIAISARSRSTDLTAVGVTSLPATRAATRLALVAYLADVPQGEAARLLAQMLGIEAAGRRHA